MSNIYVPNIIITQDYNLINKIMESDHLDITQQYSEDKAILLSNRQNKYVYSLEHSINFNQTDSKIILKILDVDNDFENKFFNETFFEKIMNQQVSNFIKNNSKINEFETYVNKALDSQIKIYVAYGIGNEFSNWSNPIACALVNAKIDLANNGLRTYTYEFQPEVNYFFKYQSVEVDKNNLLDNLSLTFGGRVTITKVDIDIGKNEYKKITNNISRLLTKFASKVTDVPESNVIALIPDIDEASNKSVSSLKEIKPNSIDEFGRGFLPYLKKLTTEGLYAGAPTELVNKKVDWTNDNSVMSFYKQYFKNIEVNKNNTVNSITPIINNKFKYTRLKEDVLSELNSKLAKEKNKANASEQEDQQEINNLTAKINELEREKENLEGLPDKGGTSGERRKKDLEKINSKIDDLISQRVVAEKNKKAVKNLYNKSISNIEKEIKIAPTVVESLNNFLSDYKSNIQNKETKDLTLSMVAVPDPNKSDDSNDPKLPDWYRAIQNVFLGIASLYKNGNAYVVPHISYESDAKFLKLFHKHGIISNPKIPCVIIGDRQMVFDYLYKNQIPANKILDHKSNFTINKFDKLYKILNDQQYAIDLLKLIRKKKNSSSFSEKIILDELSYDRDVTNLIERFTEADDTPVFLNNFKNSNVLSYSVNNTENYASVTRAAVTQNRYKTLLAQLSRDKQSKLLESGGIIAEGNLTPIDVANILFEKSSAKLLQGVNKTDKIPASVSNLYNFALEIDNLKNKIKNKTEETLKYGLVDLTKKYQEDQKKYEQTYNNLSDKDKAIFDTLYSLKAILGTNPYIFSNSQENVTIMNAVLQATIVEKYQLIPTENVLPLAEAIILINAGNVDTKNSQVEIYPGIYSPNQSFILGKITEYAMKYFLEVSLKTLPFFYLSNYRVIGQSALFYSKKLNIMNYNNLNTLDFFSGQYTILGFKHTITTKECYSEFLLNKANALAGEQIQIPKKP